MIKQLYEYGDIITYHPGYYIDEQIKEMGITQDEFAKRLDVNSKTISKLVNGLIPLSNDVAYKLSIMFGTSVSMWLKLQTVYEEKVIQIEECKKFDKEKEFANLIDYNYFIKNKFVSKVDNINDKIKNLCSFFHVSSLSLLAKIDIFANYRTATTKHDIKRIVNSNAWLQTAINIAQLKDTPPVNIVGLKQHLDEIRIMTIEEPEQFFLKLNEILYNCGITFVLLPHLKNSGINGVTKWLSHQKVLIALNDRGLRADTFWFSLFHEIKHVFQQKTKIALVNTDKAFKISELNLKFEQEADEFARDLLIPSQDYTQFVQNNCFTIDDIEHFAKVISIHPGIVVGRLQHDRHIGYDRFNNLKQNYHIPLD